jgi:hypothetical protein
MSDLRRHHLDAMTVHTKVGSLRRVDQVTLVYRKAYVAQPLCRTNLA